MPSISIVDALPNFVTSEQHAEQTGSTPASFADIAPVLRHKQENVNVIIDPPLSTLSEEELSKGTLYVIESVLVFISQSSGRGFKVDYPSIILHAVSRDASSPHIYCQLADMAVDTSTLVTDRLPVARGTNGVAVTTAECPDDVEEEEDTTETRELRITPQNSDSVEEIFEALSHCAALHPDPDLSDEDMCLGNGLDPDDLDGDEAFVDADVEAMQAIAHTVDDEPELSEAGRDLLARLDALILDPHGHLDATEDRFVNSRTGTGDVVTKEP